ncbi:hypothetical protein CW751_11525 [Brumimicrobium salinarum]|uniref:Aerotolerance regulator N-terminal domain-containing protein n=1 Tax=Brumimicrobium salinarum TaxID=2058658 RepID=A0A2I0R0N4_9FLAO|nr:BatA domain-containing protein [Brumimicrobium salinarum]PKR80127.1 hypothetical protein CW751_11525 [Brumimicrobium salinarum]
MSFVYPHILYFLFLLIIPIIIHLFNFRRYKKLYFSSLQFIKKVEKETNATRNLRHYLILACRMLAFTAIILAFAQPYIPTSTQNKSFERVVPIYIDNSLSMSAKGSNGDLLNQAKTAVQEIVDAYPRGQKFMLLTNKLEGKEYRIINKTELEDRLAFIDFSAISRSITSPLESTNAYLNSIDFDGQVHYYVLSDFQKRNLSATEDLLDTNATYSFLQMKPQMKQNLYIDSVWFDQPFQRVNQNNTLNIRVFNTGDTDLTNVALNLEIDDLKRQTLTDVKGKDYTIVSMNYTDKSVGSKAGFIELVDENLYFDNRFYFSYDVTSTVKILIVNNENSTPYPGLVYATDDFYQIEQNNVNQLKTNILNEANLIVLNELESISSGLQTQLKQLTDNGTHLLIIPSPSYDPKSYNNLLASMHLPLINQKRNKEIRIGKINSSSLFFKGMFDEKVEKITMPPLSKYFTSTVYTNANYRSLINYENGQPLFVEQGETESIYMLYSAIQDSFNNLGKSALFSSLLLRVGEKSQGNQPLSLTLGSGENYKIKTTEQDQNPLQLQNEALVFIPEMTKKQDILLSLLETQIKITR